MPSTSESLRRFVHRLRGGPLKYDLRPYRLLLERINDAETGLAGVADEELTTRASSLAQGSTEGEANDETLVEACTLVREAAKRTIGLRAFDVQLLAGLAMCLGNLVEMETGEGKTLAAVFPAFLRALSKRGVHVLTFNDYLARRDAEWMGPVYRLLGLSVGVVQDGMPAEERRQAYRADITYGTAKQVGFDLLRANVASTAREQILRPFHAVIIDEADALLVDEARIPMVIAGVVDSPPRDLHHVAELVKELDPQKDYEVDEATDNVLLTEEGIERCQAWLRCDNLHASRNLELLTALNCALHAHALLRRDVAYIVREDQIELVDELTGRIIQDRHWPYGLQTALEAKEGLGLNPEGSILGSITVHHFIKSYSWISGMTGTARAAAEEIKEMYELDTVVVPTHRPSIRVNHADKVYATYDAKVEALVDEISEVHSRGRPILVGTRSVEESEALSARLVEEGVEVRTLNARNDEMEASIVSEAGRLAAVTIATNMAGRGTDIRLGGTDEQSRDEVVALGGLYVIGTNRHESRRIDDQLRGRAGRQGDPGSTRFFISLEDDLMRRYDVSSKVPKGIREAQGTEPFEGSAVYRYVNKTQRIIEGQHFTIRTKLRAFSELVELQRRRVQEYRDELLLADVTEPFSDESWMERYPRIYEAVGEQGLREVWRRLTILQLDLLWSEHLEQGADIRETIFLEELAGKDPLTEHDRRIGQGFESFFDRLEQRVDEELEGLEGSSREPSIEDERLRGPTSTWTYLVDENPFRDQLGLALLGNAGFAAWVALVYWPLLLLWALYKKFWRRKE